MDEVFRVVTTLSVQDMRKYQRFCLCKLQQKRFIYIAILFLLLLLLSGLNSRIAPVFWGSFLMLLLVPALQFLQARKQMRTSPSLGVPQTLLVYNDHIQHITNHSNCAFALDDIHRVCETANFFYIFMKLNMVFVVSKAGFALGTPEQMCNFFSYKMPDKYRRYF